MKKLNLVLFGVILIPILLISGFIYSINKEPWIELEQHNSELHGQRISFTVPMVYKEVDPIIYYGTDEIKTKKTLFTKEDTYGSFSGLNEISTDIQNEMIFSIKSSFWVRKNWWEKSFGGHYKLMVVTDKNGFESILSFSILNQSTRKDLIKFREKGY